MTRIFCIFGLSFMIMQSVSAQTQPTIRYTLSMPQPSTHLFEVELHIDGLSNTTQHLELRLPVWRPGRYQILDLAGGVQEFSASNDKKNLQWQKTEKSLWRVETNGTSSILVKYKVYANEFQLRTRGLDDKHGFVDGSTVFMYVEEFRNFPVTLEIHPFGNWHVTTGLEGKGTTFTAPSYDYFIDCPLEIGNQQDFTFTIDGTPHVLSIFGEGTWNADTLIRDITRIVKVQKEFWGGKFPYDRFVFLLHCTPTSGGGTEHLNSTIMGTRPFVFRNPESYRGFLGLVAHEYFHTWNVKRLRPKGIVPYDFTKENYVPELWIAEGTTSYYDELHLVHAGFSSAEKYIERLASIVQGDNARPGNRVQSVAEAGFDAWIKHSRMLPQGYNVETDFYDKGGNVSLLLDLEIRHRTGNKRSLDDVMRLMYERFPLSSNGYTLNDFRSVASDVAGSSLDEFFAKYITGTEPLPWEKTLSYAGLELTKKDERPKPWLGINTSEGDGRLRITRIVAGSPGYSAGLDIGDEIVALNGFRARSSDLSERVAELKENDSVTFTIFRNEQLRQINVRLKNSPLATYRITRKDSPTDLERAIYESWLKSSWANESTTTRKSKQ